LAIVLLVASCLLGGYALSRWRAGVVDRERSRSNILFTGQAPASGDVERHASWGLDHEGFYWQQVRWVHPTSLNEFLAQHDLQRWPVDVPDARRWTRWRDVPLPRGRWGSRSTVHDRTWKQSHGYVLDAPYLTDPRPAKPTATAKVVRVSEVMVPYWLPALLGLQLATWLARPWQWLRRGVPAGHCLGCGYDCRATPGRCPECGRLSEAKP
jgi:hypothetical protein